MKKLNEGDNPKQIAEKVSEKYLRKGFKLDFSLESLENEIDKILKNEIPKGRIETGKLVAELTAYLGETICRIFGARWIGIYYASNSGMNFYSCKIEKNDFEFSPSHFFSYYLSNGKEREGSFKDYLYVRDNSEGVLRDFLGGGLIIKIKSAE
ncbi:hypothetical protein EZJ43_07870 [Pedobacter changchengzhani]|uniref:Uncharacterized protein n=1 Tax=Pedobacter changchengzhani TaxID=2529274 RepID=A0A4R5ML05_9SPHI|nr:hypothetical protein [Pedobacter changchengzhani]TDG36427.1 hypothetical protein EZJ43_07870 [Pedobacter changchengzhani]